MIFRTALPPDLIAFVTRAGAPAPSSPVLWPSGLQSDLTRPVFLHPGPSFFCSDLLSIPLSGFLWLSACLGTNETIPIETTFCQSLIPLSGQPQTLSRLVAAMWERGSLDQTD